MLDIPLFNPTFNVENNTLEESKFFTNINKISCD